MAARTLIVFYSMTGNTRRLAQELQQALGTDATDIEEIVEVRPRSGPSGALRALLDSFFGRASKIRPPQRSPAHYAQILLGTPIWAGRLSGPVRRYAASLAAGNGKVAFFCTAGESDGTKAFQELERLWGRRPVATVSITAKERGTRRASIERFVSRLNEPPVARESPDRAAA